MWNYQEILKNKTEDNKNGEPTIYFLIDEEEIVYVGQTSDFGTRISKHRRDKKFTHYSLLKCKKEEKNDLESYFILELKPKYNGTVPPSNIYVVKKRMKKWLDKKVDFPIYISHVYKVMRILGIKEKGNFKGNIYYDSKDMEKVVEYLKKENGGI